MQLVDIYRIQADYFPIFYVIPPIILPQSESISPTKDCWNNFLVIDIYWWPIIIKTSWAEQSHTQNFLCVFLFLIFWGRLPLEVLFISSIFDFKLKFKIWGRSNQWLLRYSTFNILRLSSIWGRLHFKQFWFWFGLLSLSLKLEEDPISGCWDIQLLIYSGRLPFEVVFISRFFDFGLVPWA